MNYFSAGPDFFKEKLYHFIHQTYLGVHSQVKFNFHIDCQGDNDTRVVVIKQKVDNLGLERALDK